MFDNVKCFENIQYMAKIRGVTVGELERGAGVSRGYLSRLLKEGGNAPTIIELLTSISERLDISLDSLVHGNLKSLNNKEQYLYDFIHRLVQLTENGKLDWIQEKLKFSMYCGGYVSDFLFSHNVFNSKFEDNCVIAGDGAFSALLTGNEEDGRALLVKVLYSTGVEQVNDEDLKNYAYELYIAGEGKYDPVCSSAFLTEELSREMNRLNLLIYDARSKIGLSEDVKKTVNKFLSKIDNDADGAHKS